MSELILPAGVDLSAETGELQQFPPAPEGGRGMIVNETDVPDNVVYDFMVENASLLGLSPSNTLQMYGSAGNMMTRPKWRPPTNIVEEIAMCRELADRDDDVAATVGMMQALAFGDSMQHADRDEVTVAAFNEIAEESQLISKLKEMYREWLIAFQVTTAVLWEKKQLSFMPQGADRQRSRSLWVPRIAVIPSEQIRVVGNDIFGTAKLAYRPFSGRQEVWLQEYFGLGTTAARKAEMRREDPILTTLLVEQVAYDDPQDASWVYGDLRDPAIGQYVYTLNPQLVERSTGPKGQWAHPRPLMSRNLPLLEAKRLLTIMDYCVPTDTEILTQRGWLTHDQVQVGDKTLGYNPQTKRNEWTAVTGLHHTDAEVLETFNAYWSARSTPNHRWYATWESWNYDGREYEGFVATKDLRGKKRLKLTAPAAGGDSDISPEEAALIAWIACDGNIFEHSSGAWTTHIYQSKITGRQALEPVLAGVPHRDYIKKSPQPAVMHTYAVLGSYTKGLFERAGLSREMTELPDLVMRFSVEARHAFLHACREAEGWMNNDTPCIAQNPGPVLDAIVLCAYLCGERPSVRGDTCKIVSLNLRKTVKADKLHRRSLGVQPVWCVQTELGTWTMRQGDTISLTGNCLLEAGANFLLVVKKGSDARPALPGELAALRDTVVRASRSGVLIGDHRLEVEIITPKLDELLNDDKRKLIGRKLAAALLRVPDIGSADSAGAQEMLADTEILSRVIADDRADLARHVKRCIYKPAAQRNDINVARLWFPKIILQGTQFFQDLILGLRDRGDIPRQYAVEAAGFDWDAAVETRKREKPDDKVMTPAAVPFSSPNAPGGAGGPGPQDRGGGRPAGAKTGRSKPTAPGSGKRTVQQNAGETIKAMWDGDGDEAGPIFRAGELTYAILENHPEYRVGRITGDERAALAFFEENPDFEGTFQAGPYHVIPVNHEYAETLENLSVARLDSTASLIIGERAEDRAVVARALVFRTKQALDAEETALRWGYDIPDTVD